MSQRSQPLLDSSLNFFPPDPKHIHLMGVCGTGMGAMAGLLRKSGYTISGSDSQVYPPMSDYLAAAGIEVQDGYRPENLNPQPDLVVVGNVIRRDNPEALELARLGIPYVSFPQALGEKFLAGKTSLVVAGTHGKTTTSSLLATMLAGAGLDPGFMIGGIVKAFQSNFQLGQGDYFVVEGDEYDTAFFDKGPKFLHYQPQIAILTSVEFDHADIYADFEAVKTAFARLVAIMPKDGILIACFDDPVVRDLCKGAPCKVISYGIDNGWDWSFRDMATSGGFTAFTLVRQGLIAGQFKSIMPGRHNVLNSLAVLAVLAEIGLRQNVTARELTAFQGVCRRQEVRGVEAGVTVIDDFAHHPTAVNETLAALKEAYHGQRLVAVFEPRTNSSRRTIFQERYASVFLSADEVVIKEPEPLLGVAPEELFSAHRLADDLKVRGQQAISFQNNDLILAHLFATLRSGDVVVILSNGGFDNIHQRLLALLQGRIG